MPNINNFNDNLVEKLKKDGIVKLKKFLDIEEVNNFKKICLNYNIEKKNSIETKFFKDKKIIFSRIFQLRLKRIYDDLKFFLFFNKKNFFTFATNYFDNKNIEIRYIDSYLSKKSEKNILPWHNDRAYSDIDGKKKITQINHFNDQSLKFFLYLTDVNSMNGCMSYVPGSHKISFLIRKGLYTKKLSYSSYWSLSDFKKFILKPENYNYINKNLLEKNYIQNFLNDTVNLDESSCNYDYEASAGDLIIFDEGGIHRGSSCTLTDRVVIRAAYGIKNLKKINL